MELHAALPIAERASAFSSIAFILFAPQLKRVRQESFCWRKPRSRICLHTTREFLNSGALGRDYAHELVPRFDERLGTVILKLDSQCVYIDPRFGKLREHLFAIAAIGRQD